MRAILLPIACLLATAQDADHDRARQLLLSGRAAEAAEIYRNIVKANPGNADAVLNLSIAEYKAARYREAAESASVAVRIAPGLVPAHLLLGASYLETGNFIEAVAPLERAIALDPKDRNGRLMLGDALLGTGRARDAVPHFEAASAMLPDNPRAWYGLGKAYAQSGREQDAVGAWARLMTLPPSVESRIHAAEEHDSAQLWREAAAEWKAAVEMAPANRRAKVGLAWALFRSRDYDKAMAVLKPMLGDSAGSEVPFLIGASLLNQQRPQEAIPHLQQALERDPEMVPAKAALGQALLQTGKPAEAIPLLEQATAVDQDGSTHFQLFRAYQLTGRKTEAEKARGAYQRLRSSLAAAP
jgi:tetratricopeptide (TPR) repeat protein